MIKLIINWIYIITMFALVLLGGVFVGNAPADTTITGGFIGTNLAAEKFRVHVATCDYSNSIDINDPPTQGDGAFGETGDTTMHYLSDGKVTRIRKSGPIKEIRYAVNTGADGTTGVFLEVWRWNFDNSNYDPVITSENICSAGACLSSAGSYYSHVFVTELDTQLGDIVGWYETRSGGTTATFRKITTNVANHNTLAKESPTDPDDWTSNLDATYNTTIVDFTILMAPPVNLFSGDSLGNGIPQTDGFCSGTGLVSTADLELDNNVAYYYSLLSGESSYMTSAKGSTDIATFNSHMLRKEVIAVHPETNIIWLGTNNIIAPTTSLATMQSGMTAYLNAVQEARIGIIVLNIIPSDTYDATQNTRVSDFNSWLTSNISTWSGAILVDANDCVGNGTNIAEAYRVESEAPNYIHLNEAGYAAIAACIWAVAE